MYRLCIFDLDGTLTDTLDSLTFSVNETLKEMGLLPVTADKCRQFVGNGARVLMERSLLAAGEEDTGRIDEAMQIYGRIFDANCTYHVVPYEGIMELLSLLGQKGMKLAVLSNKPHEAARPVVDRYYPGIFTAVQGALPDVPVKPDPTLLHRLMEELGASPADTLFVGDSSVDIRTARNGGLVSCGVLWGFRTRQELEAEGADYIVETAQELAELILR